MLPLLRGLALSIACGAAATIVPAPPAAAQQTTSFFAGRSLRLVVGMPPGGGVDVYARLLQRHIERHIAGRPSITVLNMPGAGSLRAVQSLAAAPEDGTTLATFSSSLVTEAILEPQRVKVDFRNFASLGNVSEDSRVCYVRAELGIKSWSELLSHRPIVLGATAAGTSGNFDAAMLRSLFHVPLRVVQGYAGAAAKRLALEKGEIDGDCAGVTSLPADWLSGGRVAILLRHSPLLMRGVPPTTPWGRELLGNDTDRQVYDFLVTPQRLGRLFLVSRHVPADRLAVLRAAFDETVADEAFLAEAARIGVTVEPSPGAEVDARIAALYASPPEIIARAKAIAAE